ncbi:MAG: hypothetical protein LW860_07965 [Xanthomonadaceae bacterium]|jgi:hypothetical protein|nr:hypothetical protein [Xanthomonadaceae bacterium]
MTFALTLTPPDGVRWSDADRASIVAELRGLDPDLGEPIRDDEGGISLVPRKGIGLDWLIEPARIVVAPQVSGVKPARAEQAFGLLLQSAGHLQQRFGLQVHAEPLARIVDLDADHEALARAWIAHCTAAAKAHVEATRAGSRFNIVAAAVLLAILVAVAQLPIAAHPLVALAVSVPLAVLVLLWFRNRARRR